MSGRGQVVAEDAKTVEKLAGAAKGALLEAITAAAGKPFTSAEALESLARAFATVADAGPRKGELGE